MIRKPGAVQDFKAGFTTSMVLKSRALDMAYREDDRLLVNLNVSPGFDSIRSDPRFTELTRKVGLPTAR